MFFDEKDIEGAYSELSRYDSDDESDISEGAVMAIIGSCGTLLAAIITLVFIFI